MCGVYMDSRSATNQHLTIIIHMHDCTNACMHAMTHAMTGYLSMVFVLTSKYTCEKLCVQPLISVLQMLNSGKVCSLVKHRLQA